MEVIFYEYFYIIIYFYRMKESWFYLDIWIKKKGVFNKKLNVRLDKFEIF